MASLDSAYDILTVHGPVRLHVSPDNQKLAGIDILLYKSAAVLAPKAPAVIRRFAKALSLPGYKGLSANILDDCDWSAVTPFRQRVLKTLFTQVAFGDRATYTDLALLTESPRAIRAVASTMRHNPFPVLIPCHRVVAQNGLGGFMGNVEGAIERKKAMLKLEAGVTI
jgi:O-6-methylguanine DNA methyltransferase